MEPTDEILETAVNRKAALALLAEGPHHRRELQEKLDHSKATCHRIIQSFDELGFLRRTENGYELSEFGRTVEEQLGEFDQAVRMADQLQPLLEAFTAAPVDFDLDLFTDATVTTPQPDDSSAPVHRYLELFEEAQAIRTLARTSFVPPLYIEEIFEAAFEGRSDGGIAIYPKPVVKNRYAEFPDIHRRVAEEDISIRYRIHEPVPFGMTIYDDDHVGLRAYDEETDTLVVFADTNDPDAVSWAENVFDYYYEQSEPLTSFDDFPDWVPDSEIYEEIR